MRAMRLMILLAGVLCWAVSAAQEKIPKLSAGNDSLYVVPDDPIIANLDQLVNVKFFKPSQPEFDVAVLNKYGYPRDSVPQFTDSVYQARLQQLNAKTPFELVYNDEVKNWIDLYVRRRRKLTSKVLGLAHTYYPIFEQVLDRYDLPLELKHLAIVESALNPTARSRAGAVGLWQFIYSTGQLFNMEINSYIDERMDPYKSTVAACEYFTFLYNIYNDWGLVLAAYNAGPGNVNRALRKAEGKTGYWEIWPYLPKETRSYLPAFIAVNYAMNYAPEHNIYPKYPKALYSDFDTVHVTQKVLFDQVSEVLQIPREDLVFLNPAYKRFVIPQSEMPGNLCLPRDKIGLFIKNEQLVYNYKKPLETTKSTNLVAKEVKKTHIVRYGEYLGYIAKRYKCTVSDIKDWNGLHSARIYPGQRLTVYVPVKTIPKKSTAKKTTSKPKTYVNTSTKKGYRYHVIQKGDTLWDIAKSYGTTVELIKKYNRNLNERNLKLGTKIVISAKG